MTATPSGRPWPGRPLRAVIEGLCGAGKTTLASALVPRLDAAVVPEYADLTPLPPWPPADAAAARAALDHLAGVEQRRQRAAAGHRVVLFDRCPLSLAAHEAGMRALDTPADVAYAARLFADQAVPDAVLHLTVPEQIAQTRLRARGPLSPHLIDSSARAAMADYYTAALARLPGRVLHLDGTRPLPQLLDLVLSFLQQVPSRPAETWTLPTENTGKAT